VSIETAPEVTGQEQRKPRPMPGCPECTDSLACWRHSRDPRSSVDGCQPMSREQRHEQRMESTFHDVIGEGRPW
jgi:hypothetical protein